MTALETRATLSIALLFCIRMLGLFMVFPVFTPYVQTLSGATPFLAGVALGIYGLTQAFSQLCFGTLSDRFSRKKIAALGFFIFTGGSFLAAHASTVASMIFGRALQGLGASGSVLMALLTDLVSVEKHTIAMAVVGIGIGLSFFMALLVGPLLMLWMSVPGIFLVSSLGGVLALFLLRWGVPLEPDRISGVEKTISLTDAFRNRPLGGVYVSVFFLHLVLTAVFVVLPFKMTHVSVYISPLLFSMIATFGLIRFFEKNRKNHLTFSFFSFFSLYNMAIMGLTGAVLLLFYSYEKTTGYLFYMFFISLGLFFLSFSLLEAHLPALVARFAPNHAKGQAMGIYATFQFLGIFMGGFLGGSVHQYFSAQSVLFSCVILLFFWLLLIMIYFLKRRITWQQEV